MTDKLTLEVLANSRDSSLSDRVLEEAFRPTVKRLLEGYSVDAAREDITNAIFSKYQQQITYFLIRKTGDPDRSQDLFQEAMVRVWRHMDRYDFSRKFSTWVYTIAGNLAKNELRNRGRSPIVNLNKLTENWSSDHRPLENESTRYRPDVLFHQRYLKDAVEDAISQLPPHHQEVFDLREREDKSYLEIADIVGTNIGTVKSRLHRARATFAGLMHDKVA